MPRPLAICIEDLDAQPKYIRCVALPGRQPGLRLDQAGQVLWQSDDGVPCELWVSADERLILYRPEGAPCVRLQRAGRSLDVPCGKPVVIIDKDQINVGTRHLRIHIHGEAPSVAAPSPLPPKLHPFGRLAQVAATAAIIGTIVATAGCTGTEPTPTIEVREAPPEPTVVPFPISIQENIHGEWLVEQAYGAASEQAWITGTLTLEGDSYAFKPARKVTGFSAQSKLDFLFDTPRGQVTIDYLNLEVTVADYPHLPIGYDAFDVPLAICTFRANSVVVGEFQIELADANTLRFRKDGNSPWSVTKQLRAQKVRKASPEPTPTPSWEAPPTETPTPIIEVRETPPEPVAIAFPALTLKDILQGEWLAGQTYDRAGGRVWLTGILTIEESSYTFKPAREVTGPSVQGKLDFLFDAPRGEVTISFPAGIKPDDALSGYIPGDPLATCMFRANSVVVGEFQIELADSNNLRFHSDEGSLWRVTKQLKAER